MYGVARNRSFGFFDVAKGAKSALKSAGQAGQRADAALQEAQGAIRQGRQVLSTVSRTAEDLEAYVNRIQHIPIEELARRFDYKTKIAVEELLSLSSFMKKSLLYLAGMATLSIYLNILTKK
jgi:hypothetical protein